VTVLAIKQQQQQLPLDCQSVSQAVSPSMGLLLHFPSPQERVSLSFKFPDTFPFRFSPCFGFHLPLLWKEMAKVELLSAGFAVSSKLIDGLKTLIFIEDISKLWF